MLPSTTCRTSVLPDLPGMGESALVPGLGFGDWLEFLRQVVAGYGREIDLVGHSLGGAIAMHLAREDWASSVALIAPATKVFCRDLRRVTRLGMPGSILLRRVAGSLVHDTLSLTREDASMLREDYGRAAPLLDAGLPWPEFGEDEAGLLAGKRVLLVWGAEDKVVAPKYAQSLRDDLLDRSVKVEAVSLPRCGHLPMLELPEELGRILSEFWNW